MVRVSLKALKSPGSIKPKLDERMKKKKDDKKAKKEKLRAKKMLLMKKMLKKEAAKKKDKKKKEKDIESEDSEDEMDLDDMDSLDLDSSDSEEDSMSDDSSDDERDDRKNPFSGDILNIDKQLEEKIKPAKSLNLPKKSSKLNMDMNMEIISKDYVDICTHIHALSKSLHADKSDKRIIANLVYFYIKYFLYSCCIKKKPVFDWLEEFKDKIYIY